MGSIIWGLLAAQAVPTQAQSNGNICTTWHTVQRGDTLSRLGQRYGMSVIGLQLLNNLGNSTRIYVGTTLCVAAVTTDAPQGTTYIVQRGDTLARIARRHGVSMAVLAQVNNIVNPNRIYVGQILVIPDVTIQ